MRGITITLYDRTQTGVDALNNPIYAETPVSVENVLVSPLSATEVTETYALTGRRAEYQISLLKGDTHDWSAGKRVDFFGKQWRIIATVEEGIEHLVPTRWHKKVQVERYEQG